MRTVQRDIVGAFIFSADNKLLLGKSIKGGAYEGMWIIPGGGIELGESKLEALQREIMEETGLDLSNAQIEPINELQTGQTEKTLRDTNERVLVDMKFYNFFVHVPDNAHNVTIQTDDDFIDAKWFAVSELASLPLTPPSIETLQLFGYLQA